ncbi:MAG TPA: pyruvate carboxylase subunit B, partial [Methanomicrobiales archaeon]|nr:pyruvate carboxylase subunit B [Methanomicrobiales archaeon]
PGFIAMAEELQGYDCDSICIKDMAGLIKPDPARELIRGIKKSTGLPVDLHSHSTAGLAPMSYQAAIEAGVDILDTAMSPFALGTSQPPTESIVASVQGTDRDTGIDLHVLREVRNICLSIREKYSAILDPISERVDSDVLLYQLPGGMISNLVSQLKEQDALNRREDVHREIPRVREDLGYPPLVTPTSQIVGTQAVFNVLIGGERYANVTKEVRDYLHGLYGKPPGPVNEEVRRKIIGDDEVVTVRPADLLEPIYESMKKEAVAAGLVKKEEDVLTYIIYPAIAPAFLKGEKKPEVIPQKQAAAAPGSSPDVPSAMEVEVDGEVYSVRIISVAGGAVVAKGGAPAPKAPKGEIEGGIRSNMQGMGLKVLVRVDEAVKKGDPLMVLEAMKMENPIASPRDGKVTDIFVDAG